MRLVIVRAVLFLLIAILVGEGEGSAGGRGGGDRGSFTVEVGSSVGYRTGGGAVICLRDGDGPGGGGFAGRVEHVRHICHTRSVPGGEV